MSIYEIRVRECLDHRWAEWFEGLILTHEGDSTILRGPLADEAALQGVLTKVGNLNLHLLSVQLIALPGATAPKAGAVATKRRRLTPREMPPRESTVSESTVSEPTQQQQVPKSTARKTRKRR